MSHNEVPVFLSKVIYMMHACHRFMEDRSPGLLQAADIKLDTLELQAGAPPPRVPDSRIRSPTGSDQGIDQAKGDEIEARVAAEVHEEHSDLPDQTSDVDMLDSNDEELHGERDASAASAASDSDVKPFAQDGGSDAEPHAQQDSNANECSDSEVEPFAHTGNCDALSNPAVSADDDMEHSDGQEETYHPVRLHATTSRFDDWLHRGPWLHALPYFLYMHNIKRVRQRAASQHRKKLHSASSSTATTHCLLYTNKKWIKG